MIEAALAAAIIAVLAFLIGMLWEADAGRRQAERDRERARRLAQRRARLRDQGGE